MFLEKLKLYARVILGVLLVCAIFEVVLQFTDTGNYNRFVNDTESGLLHYRPHSTFIDTSSCFENTVTVNNLGFHGKDVSEQKEPHTFRIVVIGSSFVEALQVPVEKMFGALLEEKLNSKSAGVEKYEIIPIGFSGNGTFLDTLFYQRFGRSLKPDLVIDLTTEYEVSHEPSPLPLNEKGEVILELPKVSQNPLTVSLKNIMRHSKLIMNMSARLYLLEQTTKNFLTHPIFFAKIDTSLDSEETAVIENNSKEWGNEEKLLQALHNTVKADGAKFVFVSWTTADIATGTEDTLVNNLSGISLKNNFPYVNLVTPIVAMEKRDQKNATFSCDGHFNEDGHAYVAQALFDYLENHRSLLSR